MPDSKISNLPVITIATGADIFVAVDTGTGDTSQINFSQIMSSPGSIGGINPDTGEFTTLELPTGATINEFSIDGTLVGNSDLAIPTEKAVKTYVDAQIAGTDEHNELLDIQGGDSTNRWHLSLSQYDGLTDGGITALHTHSAGAISHNTLGSLQGGDSTADEYYHLTQSIHDGLYSASPTIGLGNSAGTNFEVDYGNSIIRMKTDSNNYLELTDDGSQYLWYVNNGDDYIYMDESLYMWFGSNSGAALEFNGADGSGRISNQANSQNILVWQADNSIGLGSQLATTTLGFNGGASIVIDDSGDTITIDAAGTAELTVDVNGVTLKSGTKVNAILDEDNMASDSDTALATQQSVKTYVDTEINAVISLETIAGTEPVINGDSTATIIFDIAQPDNLYSVVGNLVNEIDAPPSIYGHIITEKNLSGFVVLFSGPMDSANYEFDWILSRNDLGSSSSSSSRSSSSSSSSSKSSSSSSSSRSSSSSSSKSSSSSSSSAIPAGARATDDDEVRLTDDDEIRIID